MHCTVNSKRNIYVFINETMRPVLEAPSSPGVGAGFDSELGQKLYKAGLIL